MNRPEEDKSKGQYFIGLKIMYIHKFAVGEGG